MSIRVIQPGLLTTFQDLGRHGLAHHGFTQSGALDMSAYRRGCILMGEAPGKPALEFFFMGPTLQFVREADACVTGAPFDVRVNGEAVGTERVFHIPAGATLAIGPSAKGAIGYLHIAADGFAIEPVLESCSTTLQYKLGGFEGRALQKNDHLKLGACTCMAHHGISFTAKAADYDFEADTVTVRIVPGPHTDKFAAHSLDAFFANAYEVTPKKDRMGVRLEGVSLDLKDGADIVSEGVVNGTIQVNGEGQPMIMLADHQTTGGYAVIGIVISDDLPKVAQTTPGRKIAFVRSSVEEAQQILRANIEWERSVLNEITKRMTSTTERATSCS